MSCPDCVKGAYLPGDPVGKLGFKGAYYSPAPKPNAIRGEDAVVLLTDGFGLPLKNCKIIADTLATRLGCDVWVPDILGGAYTIEADDLLLPDRAGVKMTFANWVTFINKAIPKIPAFLHNTPSKVDPRIHDFILGLREDKKYTKIGAIGYCYGGAAAVRLSSHPELVDSAVICHPGPFSLKDVKRIQVPVSWACAQEDLFFSDKLRKQSETALAARKDQAGFVEYQFIEYKGTTHGFAARPNLEVPEVKTAFEGALTQATEWFAKTLHLD
ncbi:hypothetical protein PLEOSDRAFT_1042542 [Pleurotus ostreatus PC15]|uniref:Dienelactone hydrolase domain-containing protein n=1 Tax=Pleurotus ostreatus (strain PC15) TaxID=1137138 RepID=A0A067NJE6_PLEO1|nr:hypothetical protein PLEOSDRAFT_1042542 [Pleurotus ostreatus PC15]